MHALGPNYLINIANLLILAAFAVRDVLLLRSLFLAGSAFAIGYYYFQSPPLWTAIAWTILYSVIHASPLLCFLCLPLSSVFLNTGIRIEAFFSSAQPLYLSTSFRSLFSGFRRLPSVL
jgi:hypothetical protein